MVKTVTNGNGKTDFLNVSVRESTIVRSLDCTPFGIALVVDIATDHENPPDMSFPGWL
jgi:hypothetical protein